MECTEAREYLSDYIDGLLHKEVLKGIEEHLLGCAGCRKDLSLLKSLIGDLGAMKPVHAPDDFLKSLHSRIESGFWLRQTIQTLFIPLKKKIPLELATAALMAVLVFSIWNIQQRESGLVHFPEVQKHKKIIKKIDPNLPAPSSVEKLSRSKQATRDSLRPSPDKISGKPGKASGDLPSKPIGRIKQAKARPLSQGTEAKNTASVHKRVAAEPKAEKTKWPLAKNTFRSSVALQKKAVPRTKIETSPIELILYVKACPPREAPAPCKDLRASAPPKGAGNIDEQRILVATVPAKETAEEEAPLERMKKVEDESYLRVKEYINLFNGKLLSLEHDKETGQPHSLKALIPAANFNSFCEKLEKANLLQTPPPTLPEQNREFVPVRIRFISK